MARPTFSSPNSLSLPPSLPSSTMASSRSLHRSTTQIANTLRLFSTSITAGEVAAGSAEKPSHHNYHSQNHKYLDPNPFVGSWEAPKDPREAEKKLQRLRRNYAKQIKELRKEFAAEVEVARLDKLRKEEAKREAQRLLSEERKKIKAEAKMARALKHQAFQEDLRQTLAKEREERFESWKMKEKLMQEKKKGKSQLIRRKSSMWIEPHELEQKIEKAINDSTPL